MEIFSPINFFIKHKKFQSIKFKKGFYYYVGTAQKNLKARIKRHLLKNKTLHWHIDYLTTLQHTEIKNIYVSENKNKTYECLTIKTLLNILNHPESVPNFGNSDCSNCKSHLLYSKKNIGKNIIDIFDFKKLFF